MISDLIYATGYVEDVNDPEMKARVKIRLDGYHTMVDESSSDSFGLSTEDLDWYPVLMPTTSSSRGGHGFSPSGLTKGDRVSLLILDTKYIQSAIVIGTIHGDGDTSNITIGGIDALESESVSNTNNQRSSAPNLNSQEYDQEGMEDDDVGYETFFQSLIIEEGFVDKTYYDMFRYPHIGLGSLLIKKRNYPLDKAWSFVEERLGKKIPNKRITLEEAKRLATTDINRMRGEINKFPLLSVAYNSVSKTRQYALLSMCYQMGVGGVNKFTNTLNAIIAEDWTGAYKGLTNSAWARQTPARAKRVASVIRDNNFNVYPTLNKASTRSFSVMSRNARQALPNENLNVVKYGDITDVQIELMDNTKLLRAFTSIQNEDDIMLFLDIIQNFDSYLKSLENTIISIPDLIKSVKDIDAVDYIQRYLNSFQKIMEEQYNQLKNFIVSSVNQAIEDIKEIVDLIELVIKNIFNNIMNISKDIDDAIERIYDDFYDEKPLSDETEILFTEPPSEYAGVYPNVKTTISPSGHITEVDDTPGFERLKEQHRSGTFYEINSNGRKVEKIVSERYVIVAKDDNILIEGSAKIAISGNHMINIIGDSIQTINGNLKQTVRGNSEVDIAGDSKIQVHGNVDLDIHGNVDSWIKGNVNSVIKGNVTSLIEGNVDSTIKGNVTSLIEGNVESRVIGNVTSLIEGNVDSTIYGTADYVIEGDASLTANNDVDVWVGGNMKSHVGGDLDATIIGNSKTVVDGNSEYLISGNLKINTKGIIEMYGNQILLDRS